MMYNFDRDEDYYSVVVTEDYDACHIYRGEYFYQKVGVSKAQTRVTGLTWRDLEIRTQWAHNDYSLHLQYDILQGKASPLVTTEIQGWEVSANVSIGMDGVAAKPGAKISSEKKVTSIEEDVNLTNRKDIDGNWMSWKYDFGHQPYYKDKTFSWQNFPLHEPPVNATCRSQSVQNQAWKWIVGTTKNRGTLPFEFNLKIASMQRTNAWANEGLTNKKSKVGTDVVQMNLDKSVFTFQLPVP
mgnify:CR=1 FL=1